MARHESPEQKVSKEDAARAKVAPIARIVALALTQHKQNQLSIRDLEKAGNLEPSSWAILYEIPFVYFLCLFAHVIGQEDLFADIAANKKTYEGINKISDEDMEAAWDLRPCHGFTQVDLLACLVALNRTFNCLIEENVMIDDLVRKAASGDLVAIKKAVLHDPAVIYAPSIEKQLMKNIYRTNNKFLKQVFSQARTPQKKARRRDMNLALHLVTQKVVRDLSQAERFVLFSKELKVYEASTGEKNLNGFIWRWLSKQSTS